MPRTEDCHVPGGAHRAPAAHVLLAFVFDEQLKVTWAEALEAMGVGYRPGQAGSSWKARAIVRPS